MGRKPKTQQSKKPNTKTAPKGKKHKKMKQSGCNSRRSRFVVQNQNHGHGNRGGSNLSANSQQLGQTRRRGLRLRPRKQRRNCPLTCEFHKFQLKRLKGQKVNPNLQVHKVHNHELCYRNDDSFRKQIQHDILIIPRIRPHNKAVPLFMEQQFDRLIQQRKSDLENFNKQFNEKVRAANKWIAEQNIDNQVFQLACPQSDQKNYCKVCKFYFFALNSTFLKNYLEHIQSQEHIQNIKKCRANKFIRDLVRFVKFRRRRQLLKQKKIRKIQIMNMNRRRKTTIRRSQRILQKMKKYAIRLRNRRNKTDR